MKEKLLQLEKHVTALAADPGFIHHKWFVAHHLKIFEQLANELCDLYPQADRETVLAMVWLHDLGKILTSKKLPRAEEDALTLATSRELLQTYDFPADFIEKLLTDLRNFETAKGTDMAQQNIEVKIASTADACSHFVGPFFAIYWYENPERSIEQLIEDNTKKIYKDWEQKAVLPEAKKYFADRIAWMKEYELSNREKKFFAAENTSHDKAA